MFEWKALAASDDKGVKDAFAAFARDNVATAEKVLAETAEGEACDAAGRGLMRALLLRRKGKQRDAVAMLEALRGDSGDRADLLLAQALCMRDMAQREQCLPLLKAAREMSPDYPAAAYFLGVVEQELGNTEAALPHFTFFTETEDGAGHALAHSLLGTACRNLGRFDEAVAWIEKAVAIKPDDIPIRNSLVITLYRAEREAEAIEAGRVAIRLKDDLATKNFAADGEALALAFRDAPFDPTNRAANIIAFSLWGDDPVYTHGAIVNAQIAPHIYPGWRCRFYCDDSVPKSIVDELRRLGAEIHLVQDKDLLKMKALWRFFVADDENVDRFICRDADSRLNIQEALAVDAWVKSGKPFHVMRDHPYHMEVMLAGMWGGVTRVLPNVRDMSKRVSGYTQNRWNDQDFLRDTVWPLIRDHALVHDSVYGFRGAVDFADTCRLIGKAHVGGAVKSMPPWPNPAWPVPKPAD